MEAQTGIKTNGDEAALNREGVFVVPGVFHQTDVGGNGGVTPFGRIIGPSAKIVTMHVTYGDYIDSIQMEIQDGGTLYMLERYGGQGRTLSSFPLFSGEYLANMIVVYGKYIDSVVFVTNTGRRSVRFGGTGGTQPATLGSQLPGYEICGLHGRHGDYLDKLGVYYRQVAQ